MDMKAPLWVVSRRLMVVHLARPGPRATPPGCDPTRQAVEQGRHRWAERPRADAVKRYEDVGPPPRGRGLRPSWTGGSGQNGLLDGRQMLPKASNGPVWASR